MTSRRQGHQKDKLFEIILIVVVSVIILVVAYYVFNIGLVPVRYAPALYAAVILTDGYLIVRLAGVLVERVVKPTIGETRTHGIKNFAQIVAAIVVVAVVGELLNVNLTAFLVGAGFLGIVLGLAAQQVLGNIFGGLSIFVSKPFEIGDRITIINGSYGLLGSSYSHESMANGYTGIVQDTGIFFTNIILDEGIPSVFPNSAITTSLIINHTRISSRTTRVRINVDMRIVFSDFKTKMLDALGRHEEIDVSRSGVELVDLGPTTYQVVVIANSSLRVEEPVSTMIIADAMRVLGELSPAERTVSAPAVPRFS